MTGDTITRFMIDTALLGALLLVGIFLRSRIKVLQKIFLPASLIAGFLGLCMGPQALGLIPPQTVASWATLPGRLISVVFACMFLGVRVPSPRTIWKEAGPQICFGFFAGIGQYFVAILITMLVLAPLFGVSDLFATFIEIGFSGGPGTAAGLVDTFRQLGFPEGGDLALMSATVGIVCSVVLGMLLINIAVRRGYTLLIDNPDRIAGDILAGTLQKEHRRSIGTATVASSAIDPITFHGGFVGISILLGWLMWKGVTAVHPVLESVPLFPLAMIGGIVVQLGSKATGADRFMDRQTIERIEGVSLDFLVASAIASLNLQVVVQYALPFTLLMFTGIIWMLVITWYLAPRMFPDAWFERSIVEYGMQMGVTAVGLILLRIVDPEFETQAAPSFGFKQIIYEPLLGGGLITSISPILILQIGLLKTLALCAVIMAFFMLLSLASGFFHRHPGPCR